MKTPSWIAAVFFVGYLASYYFCVRDAVVLGKVSGRCFRVSPTITFTSHAKFTEYSLPDILGNARAALFYPIWILDNRYIRLEFWSFREKS